MSKDDRRAVLIVLLDHRDNDGGWMLTSEIMAELKWNSGKAGTLQLILHEYEGNGTVEARWKPGTTDPRPRQYRVAPGKVRDLLEEFEQIHRQASRAKRKFGLRLQPG